MILSALLHIAMRLTWYALIGVLFLLLLSHFHLISDFLPSEKAVIVAVFVAGMFHGWWRRLRRSSPASRDVR